MAAEPPEIRLIRETLVGVLHPSTASTVFFDAIQTWGGALPSDPNEAATLVDGPLRESLHERLGQSDGDALADQLSAMLTRIGGAAPTTDRHEARTRSISISDQTLPVFVLTGSKRLVEGLSAAVGPKIMSPVVVTDSEMLRVRLKQIAPALLLVDASDFPAIEPEELVEQLGSMQSGVVKALWGSDLPYGQSVMDIALRRGVDITTFDRREGIAPLIDVIRSRHA